MGDKTAIEWTRGDDGTPGATWNPLIAVEGGRWQCEKISDGCEHCYASDLNVRLFDGEAYPHVGDPLPGGGVSIDERTLTQPLRWARPRRIFVCSMTDIAGEWVTVEQFRRVWEMMARAEQHTFLVLTKRPRRLAELVGPRGIGWYAVEGLVPWPQSNIWVGTTIELDRFAWRAKVLRQIPAPVHFISAEPLLGPLPSLELDGVQWVITGGESGPRHRQFAPEWAADLRDRCLAAGVSFFHKQNGGRLPKSGGRLLDGVEWSQFPQTRDVVPA